MTIDDRLDNWGRAMRWYARIGRACASLEGRYRSPQPWTAPPVNAPGAIDQVDARDIESAVIVLPLWDHTILRAWYVHQSSPDTCMARARRAAGNGAPDRQAFATHIRVARGALERALTLPAVVRRDRARARVRAILGPIPEMAETS